jgi:hypothetical protein
MMAGDEDSRPPLQNVSILSELMLEDKPSIFLHFRDSLHNGRQKDSIRREAIEKSK